MSFTAFALHPDLLAGVRALGFTAPTPIQRDAIPPALEGRDVLACAMTGSGKTAAFLLPAMARLRAPRRGVTRALVLAPTRELAAQIDEHRRRLGGPGRFTGATIVGGVAPTPQVEALRAGVDVLVATPGRLLDHLGQPHGRGRLREVEILVVDEADRMLDMGFLPDLRRLLAHVPARRQTLLFSATMPPAILALARDLLRDPVTIQAERAPAPATGITHAAYPVAAELKSRLLLALLARPDCRSVLAFTRTKHRANRLAEFLTRHGVATERIHGNRSQPQRTQALAGFKAGRFQVLVATDLAARGIDIHQLSHVVNFDVPAAAEDYVHRVGRTARAEARGEALTLVAPEEEADFRGIERAIGTRVPRVSLPGFDYAQRPAGRLEIPVRDRLAARAHRPARRCGRPVR